MCKAKETSSRGCSYGPVVNSSGSSIPHDAFAQWSVLIIHHTEDSTASASTVPTTKPIVKDNDLKGQKGKGNGKGKGKIVVPEDCEIKFGETNKPICMKFNIGTCGGNVRPGKRCQYGFHVCWKKSCHKAHSAVECTS